MTSSTFLFGKKLVQTWNCLCSIKVIHLVRRSWFNELNFHDDCKNGWKVSEPQTYIWPVLSASSISYLMWFFDDELWQLVFVLRSSSKVVKNSSSFIYMLHVLFPNKYVVTHAERFFSHLHKILKLKRLGSIVALDVTRRLSDVPGTFHS